MSRSLQWRDGAIVAVDQRQLPAEHRRLRITTLEELIEAIDTRAIRGAPALRLAGALRAAARGSAVHWGARWAWLRRPCAPAPPAASTSRPSGPRRSGSPPSAPRRSTLN